MSRMRTHGAELTFGLRFMLEAGPTDFDMQVDGITDEHLEVGWQLFGEHILSEWTFRDGSRPWAWWTFTMWEEPPPQEPGANVVRLAELGQLTDAEYAAIADRANKAKAQMDSGKVKGEARPNCERASLASSVTPGPR